MKPFLATLAAATLAAVPLATASAGDAAPAGLIASEWHNPSNSVHVRIDRCGATQLCGTVTWASAKAQADARRGGTQNLIGTRLFQGMEPAGAGKWRGKVFVPDIRRTFSGTVAFNGTDKMVGKGCVLFGAICKSQTWSRIH